MEIRIERIYNEKQAKGYRVLVDRIWPRGITKQAARLDEWCKELAPSTELRKWFGHQPEKFTEFKKRYRKELAAKKAEARDLIARAGKGPMLLLYGAKDPECNHAVILQEFLRQSR